MTNYVRTSANARELISYWELSPAWQAEARSNSDNYEENTYVAPRFKDIPGTHILWDLEEAIRTNIPDFDGIISVSNNSAMGIKLSGCGDACWLNSIK